MATTKGKSIFYKLQRHAARNRNHNYRRRLKLAIARPGHRQHAVDLEWRQKFQRIRKRGQQPRVRLIDVIARYCETYLIPTMPQVRFRSARNLLLRFAEIVGPEKQVHQLTEADLTNYRDDILRSGRKPTSANRFVTVINGLLSACCDNWRIIDEVPFVSQLKVPVRPYRYLTESEETRLLASCSTYLRRLVVFFLGTGARKAEALGLTWNDVFIDGVRRGWVRFTKTKNGKPHSVPLPNHVRDMLADMRLQRPTGMDHVFWHVPSRDFRNAKGKLTAQAGVPAPYLWPDRDFRLARAAAGLFDVRIHDLRHTYASRLVMKGVSLAFINKLLNHSDLDQTARYAHFTVDQLAESVSTLDARAVWHPANNTEVSNRCGDLMGVL
jgi:integrase